MAAGALQALREAGMRVPEDVAVVGFDDLPLASQDQTTLTTVAQPIREMAEAAVRLLTRLIQGEELDEPRRPRSQTGHQRIGMSGLVLPYSFTIGRRNVSGMFHSVNGANAAFALRLPVARAGEHMEGVQDRGKTENAFVGCVPVDWYSKLPERKESTVG